MGKLKTAITIFLLICLIGIFQEYINDEKEINFNVFRASNEEIERRTLELYVLDENDYIVAIETSSECIDLDTCIVDVFNKLTSNVNSLPASVHSPITLSTKMNNYHIEDEILYIDVTERLLQNSTDLSLQIQALKYSFLQFNEINHIALTINNVAYPNLTNESIDSYLLNPVYVSNDPTHSKVIEIMYYSNSIDGMIFIDYIVNENIDDFTFITTSLMIDEDTFNNPVQIDCSVITKKNDTLLIELNDEQYSNKLIYQVKKNYEGIEDLTTISVVFDECEVFLDEIS